MHVFSAKYLVVENQFVYPLIKTTFINSHWCETLNLNQNEQQELAERYGKGKGQETSTLYKVRNTEIKKQAHFLFEFWLIGID